MKRVITKYIFKYPQQRVEGTCCFLGLCLHCAPAWDHRTGNKVQHVIDTSTLSESKYLCPTCQTTVLLRGPSDSLPDMLQPQISHNVPVNVLFKKYQSIKHLFTVYAKTLVLGSDFPSKGLLERITFRSLLLLLLVYITKELPSLWICTLKNTMLYWKYLILGVPYDCLLF